MGKSKTPPFPTYNEITTSCFNLIQADTWGIASTILHSHHKYFFTFIDDYNHFIWIYFLHAKSEVYLHLQKF